MPEEDRVVVMVEPIGEKSLSDAKCAADQAADRAIHVSLDRHRVALGSQPRNGEVWPLSEHIRQFRPNRLGGMVLHPLEERLGVASHRREQRVLHVVEDDVKERARRFRRLRLAAGI
jgi:hypothetical protein